MSLFHTPPWDVYIQPLPLRIQLQQFPILNSYLFTGGGLDMACPSTCVQPRRHLAHRKIRR
jgi:hypothetical protein